MAHSGAYTIDDLLDVRHQTVDEFGEDTVAEVVLEDLRILNEQIEEQLSFFAMPITEKADRQGIYGTSTSDEMVEIDELGRTTATKVLPGQTVGFPLRKYGRAVGFTRDYFANATVRDFVQHFVTLQKGYHTALQRQIREAIYTPTNSTWIDRFVDNVSLNVKAFLNADGADIPNGPNGETFDGSTLTHYLANNGWNNAFLIAAVDKLTDHGHTNYPVIIIHKSDQTTVEGLANFTKYADDRLIYVATDRTGRTLDRMNTGNRPIGIFHDAEVWVKPWGINDHPFIFDAASPEKPLKFRQHHVASLRGFRLAAQFDDYPLRCDIVEAYFGMAPWTRSNGVVVDFGAASYTKPSF